MKHVALAREDDLVDDICRRLVARVEVVLEQLGLQHVVEELEVDFEVHVGHRCFGNEKLIEIKKLFHLKNTLDNFTFNAQTCSELQKGTSNG